MYKARLHIGNVKFLPSRILQFIRKRGVTEVSNLAVYYIKSPGSFKKEIVDVLEVLI